MEGKVGDARPAWLPSDSLPYSDDGEGDFFGVFSFNFFALLMTLCFGTSFKSDFVVFSMNKTRRRNYKKA